MKLPDPIRLPLAQARRSLCETFGIPRYSRPSLNGLDKKLEQFLDFDGGFFVEAGANDGFLQSNTYYFERLRGWRGVLVEPIPELVKRCRKLRRQSTVVQAALVGPDYVSKTIDMHFAGLMSLTEDAFEDEANRRRHLENAVKMAQVEAMGSYTVSVPARTLSDILDEVAPGQPIDLLSIDVEGAEVSALSGLDLERHAPKYVCVEARSPSMVCAMLEHRYELVSVLVDSVEHQDILLRRK